MMMIWQKMSCSDVHPHPKKEYFSPCDRKLCADLDLWNWPRQGEDEPAR